MRSISFLLGAALALVPFVHATVIQRADEFSCVSKKVLSTSYIGNNNDVLMEVAECAHTPTATSPDPAATTASPDVCGATCGTSCFTPSGGPTAADCVVIADALLYANQSQGQTFPIGPTSNGTNVVSLTYKTCYTMFVNQVDETLTYCRDDWSSLVSWLSSDCSSANNAQGGLCLATDGRWFVQVNHS